MDITDKRVLVVGGAGQVGSHLIDQRGHEPVREIVAFDYFAEDNAQPGPGCQE